MTHSKSTSDVGRPYIGRYAILRVLGKGGMGEVVQGYDASEDRSVAIKTIDSRAASDPELLARFESEARAAMVLDHPNIGKIYGMEWDDDQPFLVLEFIEGDPIDRYLKRNPDIPFSTLVDIVIQAARGLEAAFRRSIIHRDIKPSNLIINRNNVVKLIDFGLAKSLWQERSGTGGVPDVVGTPRYISPEQALGGSVDHRSDIYSLGATFYEMITRQTPFDGDTSVAIMLKQVSAPLIPPYLINPLVPHDVNDIICRMLDKDPDRRYQDYEPLIRDLESAKIHRLAKERRVEQQRAVALQHEIEEVAQSTTSPETSYLDQGIITIDPKEFQSPQGSASRAMLWVALLTMMVAFSGALWALLHESPAEGGVNRPPLIVRTIRSFASSRPDAQERAQFARLAVEDAEKIRTTRERMERLLEMIVEFRKKPENQARIPRVKELRAARLVTIEDSSDAWGHDLVVTTADGGNLMARSRDGVDGTVDDFVFSLDGMTKRIPVPLTAADHEEQAAAAKKR